MAVDIAVQVLKGPYPGTVAANALDIAETAGTVAGNSFKLTGREILVCRNTATGAAGTVTITSVADRKGRTADITAYSIGATEIAMFFFGNREGWDSGGVVNVTPSATTIKIAVVQVPIVP